MAYVYICDECRHGYHEACEKTRDIPTDPDLVGGGHCVCSHSPERSKFEQSIWDNNG